METQREQKGRSFNFSEIWTICSDTSQHGFEVFSKYVSDYLSQEVGNIEQDLVQEIKKEKKAEKKKQLQQLIEQLENFIQKNSALLHKIEHPKPILYTALKGSSEMLGKLKKALQEKERIENQQHKQGL